MQIGAKFIHTVEFDEENQRAVVMRRFPDGFSHLFNLIDLSPIDGELPAETLLRCAQRIGEELIIDSPAGRRLFGL